MSTRTKGDAFHKRARGRTGACSRRTGSRCALAPMTVVDAQRRTLQTGESGPRNGADLDARLLLGPGTAIPGPKKAAVINARRTARGDVDGAGDCHWQLTGRLASCRTISSSLPGRVGEEDAAGEVRIVGEEPVELLTGQAVED